MSCESQYSCPGRTLLKLLFLLFLAAILMANSKEIARYIKISTM